METHYERVKGQWEERFETRYGYWRACVDEAVARYLDCGILENGFARVRCGACRSEFLVAFSCKCRGPCPSCSAKRAAVFAAFVREEILEPVGHAQWVLTLPKMLRAYFLHHRELLGDLCRLSYETVRELSCAAAGEEVQPGFVAVIQTFGSDLRWNPHCHGLASRGGWTPQGRWVPVPYVDTRAAELLFRHKVLKLLLKKGLLPEERAALLLNWHHHTGFSVHNQTRVASDEPEALERLARYLLRPAVSLERLHLDEESGEVCYRPKAGHDPMGDKSGPQLEERFDPLEFVARVVAQIPHPRLHEIRYYGAYSAVVRARRRQQASETESEPSANSTDEPSSDCDGKANQALRRQWAELIRRIYETDPLVCKNCGQPMSIIAFITERAVILKILRHLDNRGTSERGPPNTG